MMRQLATVRLISVVTLLTACREGPAMFSPPDPFTGVTTGQLTFNARGDHGPAWRSSADSIFYEAKSYPGFPTTDGLLLQVPRAGGTAALSLGRVQTVASKQPFLSSIAFTRDGNTVAFFELDARTPNVDRVVCPPPGPQQPPPDTTGIGLQLVSGKLRVRTVNSTSEVDQASISVPFTGASYNGNSYLSGSTAYPYRRLFVEEGEPVFRPSFSPDATKLVFSDGLQLRLWTIGQAASTVLPNSADGITPAWSPDGALIAFSLAPRGGTTNAACQGYIDGVVLPVTLFTYTMYTNVSRPLNQLFVIKPDGTGLKALGLGDAPAWRSDSKTVVVYRGGKLVNVNVETGAATDIPNTDNGFEPAISPDGKYLAFSKRFAPVSVNPTVDYNIWVVNF